MTLDHALRLRAPSFAIGKAKQFVFDRVASSTAIPGLPCRFGARSAIWRRKCHHLWLTRRMVAGVIVQFVGPFARQHLVWGHDRDAVNNRLRTQSCVTFTFHRGNWVTDFNFKQQVRLPTGDNSCTWVQVIKKRLTRRDLLRFQLPRNKVSIHDSMHNTTTLWHEQYLSKTSYKSDVTINSVQASKQFKF